MVFTLEEVRREKDNWTAAISATELFEKGRNLLALIVGKRYLEQEELVLFGERVYCESIMAGLY